MAMKPMIQCTHCAGRGTVELPERLQETLNAVGRGCTTDDLQRKIPAVTPTAQNNRLEMLRNLGFLTRNRVGKFWFYAKTGKRNR